MIYIFCNHLHRCLGNPYLWSPAQLVSDQQASTAQAAAPRPSRQMLLQRAEQGGPPNTSGPV